MPFSFIGGIKAGIAKQMTKSRDSGIEWPPDKRHVCIVLNACVLHMLTCPDARTGRCAKRTGDIHIAEAGAAIRNSKMVWQIQTAWQRVPRALLVDHYDQQVQVFS